MRYILFICPLIFLSCKNETSHLKPVQNFQIERYSGKWFEIARFDHRFERGLDEVTATYGKKDEKYYEVLNEGIKPIGGKSEIVGKARLSDPELNEGLLKVSFFWFFEANYKIIYLDKDYTLAVVCSDSKDYLWWLSRKPKLSEAEHNMLLEFSKNAGFDADKLIFPKHSS